jgi:GNAT superfamily N-acetyltransferase
MIRLERVIDTLPHGLARLRDEAGRDGHRMLDTLVAEWASGATRFERPGEMLLAAYVGEVLAGLGGLTREPGLPGAFRMRRFFVAAEHRRAGVGRALAAALLADARHRRQIVTANAAAGSEPFWEALGLVRDRRGGWTHILVA